MERLKEIGFQLAGQWKLVNGQLELELTKYSGESRVLYAFTCNETVKYIGKTTQPLRKRLYGYKFPGPSQSTNIRNSKYISALLKDGEVVQILVFVDNKRLQYGGFEISLAAGLEDSLIQRISPSWNGERQKSTEVKAKNNSEGASPITEIPSNMLDLGSAPIVQGSTLSNRTFQFQLATTYYNTGFFNVSVEHTSLFAGDGANIDIFVGHQRDKIDGHINRSANTNHTPRIMGGVALRDWFQRNSKINRMVTVEILSPRSIWISKP